MSEQSPASPVDADLEELVAYLDGELPPASATRIEQRLAADAGYRDKLRELQRTWDLLDLLPRAQATDTFTQSTVEMVAVGAADEVRQVRRAAAWRRLALAIGGGLGVAAAAVAGFLLARQALDQPNRQLVRDLPVIENLDRYQHAGSLEFLRQLEEQGLFAPEVDDAL